MTKMEIKPAREPRDILAAMWPSDNDDARALALAWAGMAIEALKKEGYSIVSSAPELNVKSR